MNIKQRRLYPPIWTIIATVLEPGLDSVAWSLFFSARRWLCSQVFYYGGS